MKEIGYIATSLSTPHVSRYAIENIERAVAKVGMARHEWPISGKLAQRFLNHLYRAGGIRAVTRKKDYSLLLPMMGMLEWLVFPWAYSTNLVPIVFDCHPSEFRKWEILFRRNRISMAMFTAKAYCMHFKQAMPEGNWHWLPEAIDIDQYSAAKTWEERHIDLLEFGRRYEKYHTAFVHDVAEAKLTHLYERKKGELVFATKSDFIHGLASAKISVCFPQSLTHPERFGGVETLTQRYLESMASGCVLLGKAPAELIELLGYDPVVAVDWTDVRGQVDELVRCPERHAALRARNLAAVRQDGTWTRRADQLAQLLRANGFANPRPLHAT